MGAEHSGQRAICIAADDYGLRTGINHAVLRLAELGRVQAIGCMVAGPAWLDGAAALRRLDPAAVDLGLHLDLTEHPLPPFGAMPLAALVRDSQLRRLDGRALQAQIHAQLDAFAQALGRPPAYVDGHQHVHQFPQVRNALVQVLAERGGRKPWLRATHPVLLPAALQAGGWLQRIKPWGIAQLGARGLARLARQAGHAQNGRLLGVYNFSGPAALHARRLQAWLAAARDGDLLMCHPGWSDAMQPEPLANPRGVAGRSTMDDARAMEVTLLASPAFAAMCCAAGLALLPMSAILARRQRGPTA